MLVHSLIIYIRYPLFSFWKIFLPTVIISIQCQFQSVIFTKTSQKSRAYTGKATDVFQAIKAAGCHLRCVLVGIVLLLFPFSIFLMILLTSIMLLLCSTVSILIVCERTAFGGGGGINTESSLTTFQTIENPSFSINIRSLLFFLSSSDKFRVHTHFSRNTNTYILLYPNHRTMFLEEAPEYSCTTIFNNLSDHI